MDIDFQNAASGGWRLDCALLFICENESPVSCAPGLLEQAPWLEISPGLRDVRGKKDECALLYGHPDNAVSRVLVWGLGKRERFTENILRKAVARAVQFCRDKGFARLGLPVEALDALIGTTDLTRETLLRESVAAALLCLAPPKGERLLQGGGAKPVPLGGPAAQKLETRADDKDAEDGDLPDPRVFSLLFTATATPEAARLAARSGEAEALGVRYARALANVPGNLLPPAMLAEKAGQLAQKHGFKCSVLDEEALKELGMGALLAVGRGSSRGPRFIILEHCPKGREQDDPIILAGKGVTFDSGGISLKAAAKMHEMKSDMGGAAAVLGFFETLGNLPEPQKTPRIIGLIAAAENMPGGNATRPGDVIKTFSGLTVEILNTDAEGRLVLCDALAYAQKHWRPALLLDLATLTGACVVALGDYGSGLFTDDEALRADILAAAAAAGDLVWPLPLWDDYDDNLKSDFADIGNMGPREGGAINAALFLRRFIDKGVRWAHLDIAGPGYVSKSSPLLPLAGGTGVGVRLLCRLLEN
ncbi:leucyl aminopeptidase [Desulfovibrio sp. OttesenSCG-928-G11]|nr:leucyl aminopeptidase [Desulfovibrio sp. OttesenSCG-928-G11]